MVTPTAELLALSPCPFCGGTADLNGDDTCGYFVSCRTRDCCMFNRAIWAADEIRNAWNTRARPSLSAQAVGDGWLPIESAPKSVADGTRVEGIYLLGFVPDADAVDPSSCMDTIWWEPLLPNNAGKRGKWCAGKSDIEVSPTHWQPLPESPGTTPPQPADGGDRVGELVEALSEVVRATRAYLPPDGIDAAELISRVIAATDNPKINAAMGEIL